MNLKNPGLAYYVGLIESQRPFSFVRFADGEWTAGILHDRARTTSGSQALTIPELQQDMRRALTGCYMAENYFPGLRATSLNPVVEAWLVRNVPKGVAWHDCRVFYLSSAHGVLFPLIRALRNLSIPLIFVGPSRHWILRLSGIFPKASVIVIPDTDCYVLKKQLIQQVLDSTHPACFAFSAGPAAKVMIHELYPVVGNTSFLLDFGSLWDIYVGHVTRRYHKSMTFETIQKNLFGP